jgi:murein DD-endopeptidase MepM/ murein hydrolase activator NlpD
MKFDNLLPKGNTIAKKKRHQRLGQSFAIKSLSKEKVAKETLVQDQKAKGFFWQVASLATVFFFIFSLIPGFVSADLDLIASAEANEVYLAADQGVYNDPGVTMMPAVQTEEGSRENFTEPITVTVHPGDTLSGIAQRYGVTSKTIIESNDIKNPNQLKSGIELLIIPVNGLLHEVEKKETIESIAKKYKSDKEKIVKQNDLDPDAELKVGQRLILPGGEKPEPPKPKVPTYVASTTSRGTTYSSSRVYTPAPANSAGGSGGNGNLFFPAQGVFTQYYRYGHYAVDIAKRSGSPIWAADGGKVIKSATGWNGGYGNMVIVDHGNGMQTLYAHFREIYVNTGDYVQRGQALGYMGTTGRSTGVHLHFEVIVNGAKKNPLAYIAR